MEKNRLIGRILMPALAAIAFAGFGVSQAGAQDQPASSTTTTRTKTDQGAMMTQTQNATVTVEKIDKSNRELTVKDANGKMFEIAVGPDVQAFDKLKKGDKVDITYHQALAVRFLAPGEKAPVSGTETNVERQPQSGTMARQRTATVEVVDLNKETNTISVKGPKGNVFETTVQDPDMQKKLQELKKGDKIALTYTEAVAVSVTPAEKTK